MSTAVVERENQFDDFEPVYFNEEIVRREAVRYLFFPGDVIDPRRKQERREFSHGGEEIGSPCLVRTKQFLRRCRISPLERWGDPMPIELIPNGVTPIGITPVAGQGSEQGFTSFKGNLHGFPKYPGEEINWILQTADHAGIRKGIVEITPLRTIEWRDFEKTGIQHLFFPNYPELPIPLREIENMIRGVDSSESMIKQIKEEMLDSCAQFRLWATARAEVEHILVKLGTTPQGWTFRYSGLGEVLLPQLEMERADQYLQNQTQFQGDLVKAQAQMAELISTALQKSGVPAQGADVGSVVTVIQAQMAEANERMMRQNQDFLTTVLTRLFGDVNTGEREPAGQEESPKSGGVKAKNQPTKNGDTTKG